MKQIFLLITCLTFVVLGANAQVGIGTTTPNAMLDVRGLYNGYVKILQPTTDVPLPNNNYDMFEVLSKDNGGFSGDARFFMNAEEGIHLDFGPTQLQIGQPIQLLNNLSSFTLTQTNAIFNGNRVGIGTTNPQSALEIQSNDDDNLLLTAPNGKAVLQISGGSESEINFSNNIGFLASLSGGTDGLGQGFQMQFPGYYRIHSQGIYEYLFMRQGFVGIGTTAPTKTLHLFNNSAYPVLRIEAGNGVPSLESGHLDFVYTEGDTKYGHRLKVIDGELHFRSLLAGAENEDPDDVWMTGNGLHISARTIPTVSHALNLSVDGSVGSSIRTINSSYAMSNSITETTILCNAASGNIAVDLYNAKYQGRILVFKKIDSSPNTITLNPNIAVTIDGASSYVLSNQWQFVTLQYDGSNWYVIGKN